MLTEIRCEKFRTGSVSFHPGLNVVLGDENATNSIGKSTLLMIVDFAFGGSDLLKHNSDIVVELGHHDYFFTFDFDGKYRFRRGTLDPTAVFVCDEQYRPIKALELDEFTAFLKQAYELEALDISFRQLIGLHLRIWGKDNLSVEHPLHIVQSQSGTDCVNRLLKEFEMYGTLQELSAGLEAATEKHKAILTAKANSVIPKISRSEYLDNQSVITRLETELADIRQNLARYATNLSAIVNEQVLELKIEKDELLSSRLNIASQLQRVGENLREARGVRSSTFQELMAYFPEVNQERLLRVENFHNGLAKVLRAELRESERHLQQEIEQIDLAISEIDNKMAASLTSIDQPSVLVDRVFDVALNLEGAKQANTMYEEEATLRLRIADLRSKLVDEKERLLAIVEGIVNDGMREVVTAAFGPDRKSPQLFLRPAAYDFDVVDDTGTGTAYSSLIVFDLTIFFATRLPTIAHDTVLFKNIENDSVAALIPAYMRTTKQSFIALDEVHKYGQATVALLTQQRVIDLDDDHVLYIKDWRAKAESIESNQEQG